MALLPKLLTPTAQAKSIASMRKARAEGRVTFHRGADNATWKGGRVECYKRRLASGAVKKSRKKYLATHPGKSREFTQRRKSRIIGKLPSGTVARLQQLQKNRCANCRKKLTKFHLDHIVPLAKGGLHASGNVQLLCPNCNSRKSAKDPIDFAQQEGRLL